MQLEILINKKIVFIKFVYCSSLIKFISEIKFERLDFAQLGSIYMTDSARKKFKNILLKQISYFSTF